MADKWIGDLIGALCSALGRFLGIDIFFYDIIAAIGTLLCAPFSVHDQLCGAGGNVYRREQLRWEADVVHGVGSLREQWCATLVYVVLPISCLLYCCRSSIRTPLAQWRPVPILAAAMMVFSMTIYHINATNGNAMVVLFWVAIWLWVAVHMLCWMAISWQSQCECDTFFVERDQAESAARRLFGAASSRDSGQIEGTSLSWPRPTRRPQRGQVRTRTAHAGSATSVDHERLAVAGILLFGAGILLFR